MLTATVLALASAFCHASWNLIIKVSGNRDAATTTMFMLGGVIALPILVAVGVPEARAWPFLVAGAVVQVVYAYGLSRAYTFGDYSFAYPIARGSGSLLVAIGGTVLLGDHLAPLAWAGIGIVALSMLLLVRRGATAQAIRWALFTGVVICTYQLFDAVGTRRSSSGLSYGLAVAVMVGLAMACSTLVRGMGSAVVVEVRGFGGRLLAAAVLMVAAYTMVLIAFHDAPVGYVSVLRESSVVVGAALGWLFLREGFGRYRVVSTVVMVTGMALLIAGG